MAKWIVIIIAVFAIAAVVFVAATTPTVFFVTHGNAELLSDSNNNIVVEAGQAYYFRTSSNEFDVKVIPAEQAKDFNFVVDGRQQKFSSETDLTAAFHIEKSLTGFVLFLDNDLTMQKVLEKAYPGNTVSVSSEQLLGNQLAIVVTHKNAVVVVQLQFGGVA